MEERLQAIARGLLSVLATSPHWVIGYTLFPSGYAKVPLFLGGMALVALIGVISSPHRLRVWRPLAVLVVLHLGTFALAAVNGVDPNTSFWGTELRQGGVVPLIFLVSYSFFLVRFLRTERHWTIFFRCLFIPAVAAAVFVLWVDLSPASLVIMERGNRATGWFAQPLFYGNYIVLATFLGALLATRERGLARVVVWVGVAITGLSALFTDSRTPVLALVVGGGTALVVWGIAVIRTHGHLRTLRFLTICVVGAVLLGVLALSFRGLGPADVFRWRFIQEIGAGQAAQPRWYLWHIAWRGFLARPLFGWGPEQFSTLYDRLYDPHLYRFSLYETFQDKPHNGFLEVAATTGVLGGLTFIALLVVAGVRVGILVRASPTSAAACAGALAAYMVGVFFLFDTFAVQVLFFAWLAFLMRLPADPHDAPSVPFRRGATIGSGLLAVLLVGLAISVWSLVVPASGAAAQTTDTLFQIPTTGRGMVEKYQTALDRALDMRGPHQHELRIALAFDFLHMASRGMLAADDVRAIAPSVRGALEAQTVERPDDFSAHYYLGQLLTLEGEYGDLSRLPQARSALEKASHLSPRRQAVDLQVGRTWMAEYAYPQALAAVERAIAADPGALAPVRMRILVELAAGNEPAAVEALLTFVAQGGLPADEREYLAFAALLERHVAPAIQVDVLEGWVSQYDVDQSAAPRLTLMRVYERMGRLAEALVHARIAAGIDQSSRDHVERLLKALRSANP